MMTTTRPVAIKGIRLPREAALREEQADEYGPGGYRQIHVGECINGIRYRVVRKLGFGHFSTVWLVKDERRNKHVALKVVKSAYKYAQTAIDEIALLRIIQHKDRGGLDHPGRKHIVEFLDCFSLHPTNDIVLPLDRDDPSPRNVCMTFEPLGENLLTLLKRLSTCDETNLKIGIPLVLVQQIIRQILWGLDFLHTHCQLVHTDLKLENVIVAVEDVEELVCACRASEHMTGVSPTNATRSVPMKESTSPHGSLRNVVPGGGDWRNQREITITGSSPLPSPMHAWGRVNVGPEVNSLALIMTQLATQRKIGEGPVGDLNIPITDYDGDIMGESSSSDEQHRDEQRPSAGTSDSGASSLASVNSSATLSSMTSASTAPTSMESSLIIPTSSPVVKQHMGSPSRFMTRTFSPDQVEDTVPDLGPSKRLSSQSNLTLKHTGAQASSPSKDVTLTPIPTPTPYSQQHHPINASLLTAKKPANANTSTFTSHKISHISTLQPPSSTPIPLPTAESADGPTTRDRGRRMVDEPRTKSTPTFPKPPPRIRVKIADMGNATPMSKHFTPDIQTRPYRAPEVLLGYRNWTESVDIWSVGTMVFELLTSDLLFFAEEDKKFGRYTRDDDHLAQIIELLGDFPWARKWGGRYSKDFFNDRGTLRRVAKLRPWSLKAVLTQKYDYPQEQAEKLRDFMLPMLALDPNDRPSAAELAKHPWLDDPNAAPPYAADRVSATDDFHQVDDARLSEVIQALRAVSIQSEIGSHSAAVLA